jgi:hypothetical protein
MKYLFTYAFKTVQNSFVYLRHIDEALKKGKPELLIRSLSYLQDLLPLLENIEEPTYSPKQAKQGKELYRLISSLILLPEDIELAIKELENKCITFLQELDPFRIETLESTGIRKARLIEELIIIEDRLEILIENYSSTQVSIILPLTLIEEKIDEIQYIDSIGFSKEEIDSLQGLLYIWEDLNHMPTEKGAINLLTKVIALENILRNHMSYKDAIEILEQGLKESFYIIESEDSTEFLKIVNAEHMKDAMFLLSRYAFSDESLNFSLDELFKQYQNLLDDYEENNTNLEEVFYHIKNFRQHLEIIREQFNLIEQEIELNELPFFEEEEDH